MKYNKEFISNKIKTERNKLKLSQSELGKMIPVSGKQISNYESGALIPPIEILIKLCDIFDCELGYLLGEEDYSSGTKLDTLISNKLGISNDSINSLCYITGESRDCIDFGHESNNYTRILNSFLTSDRLIEFIKSVNDLDHSYQTYNESFSKLEKNYGKENVEKGFEYYQSHTDYINDKNSDNLSDIFLKLLSDIDNVIDKNQEMLFTIKVQRYLVRESFERFIDCLYPQVDL